MTGVQTCALPISSLGYEGDAIINSVGDVLSTILGFWLASRLPWKWTVALFVLFEVAMLLTIRDNLTLNVIMLVWPIDTIRHWQLAR